jgi:hypothetical protein
MSVGRWVSGTALALVMSAAAVFAVCAPALAEPAADPLCAAVEAIVGDDAAAAAQLSREVLVSTGDREVAAAIIECQNPDEPAPEDATASVCAIAATLNEQKKYAQTVAFSEAYAASVDAEELPPCLKEQLSEAQAQGASSTTPSDLGALWAAFEKSVLTPLTSSGLFVLGSALALVVLARILALLRPFRDPWYRWMTRRTRVWAWILGLALAILTPAMFVLLGMWLMRAGGPEGEPVEGPFAPFAWNVVSEASWRWWLLVLGGIAAVVLLAYAFASKMRLTLDIKSKDDGKGLDATRVMASIDGMAGAVNRGLEFPVGTDVTTASEAVSQLSENTVLAFVQAAAKAILGTSPWRLSIENEAEDAASIAISRNGALIAAKRIELAAGSPIAMLSTPSKVDRMAALIAGELIAQLRLRYRADLDPNLNGATRGESIALQFIASSSLSGSRDLRSEAMPVLARAVEIDPGNRGASATLQNFAYRDPIAHGQGTASLHREYRDSLKVAIKDELTRITPITNRHYSSGYSPSNDPRIDPLWMELPPQARRVHASVLRGDGLLMRLVQNYFAAAANYRAANPAAGPETGEFGEDQLWALRVFLFDSSSDRNELPTMVARRRQLLLIDALRRVEWEPGDPLPRPVELERETFRHEREAWDATAAERAGRDLADLFACEEAALDVMSPHASDPVVAYSLACCRAIKWWRPVTGLEGNTT